MDKDQAEPNRPRRTCGINQMVNEKPTEQEYLSDLMEEIYTFYDLRLDTLD